MTEALTPETIDALKQKLNVSRLYQLEAKSGESVLVRMPTTGDWRRFRSQLHEERKRVDAPETLLRSCIVHPDKAGFDAMVEEMPGLLDNFAAQLVELASGDGRSGEKKVL